MSAQQKMIEEQLNKALKQFRGKALTDEVKAQVAELCVKELETLDPQGIMRATIVDGDQITVVVVDVSED